MKKKIIIVFVLMFILFGFAYHFFWLNRDYSVLKEDSGNKEKEVALVVPDKVFVSNNQISINGHVWRVELANNESERILGLSGRTKLAESTGLLFLFESEEYHGFWMKDMLIPIDIIFFDKDWRIVSIESNLSPDSYPRIFGGGTRSQYVLEINASESILSNLSLGDRGVFLEK